MDRLLRTRLVLAVRKLQLGLATLTAVLLVCGTGTVARAQAAYTFPGTTATGQSAPVALVPVTITSGGLVSSVQVLTQGNSGFDFQNAALGTCAAGISYPAGQSCTVSVQFAPQYPGQRLGAVVLVRADGTALGTTYLAGSATGAIGAFVPGIINTIAGDAAWIYSSDGGPATSSSIFLPFGIAVDAAGNLFIADSSNNRIRKVTASTGIISTIAGNGIVGLAGDGGPATQAELSGPVSVALDGAGNVFFTDAGNSCVRRIDAFSGIITTVVGAQHVAGFTGDGGPALAATLNTPNGITLDAAGNLYIADTGNSRIREVNAATGIISTIAGAGGSAFAGDGGPATAASLDGPWSVTVSAAHEIYIADQGSNRIRKIDVHGVINTVAGNGQSNGSGDGGLALNAALNVPANVVLDVAGNLYIADSGNNRVRKVNAQTQIIETIAGTSSESISGDGAPATQASLYGPYTLAIDGLGNLYIADVFHNRVREITASQATFTYPVQRVGRVSAPQNQTFENDGNAPLTISALNAVTNAQVDSTTTCSVTVPLAPLDTCVIAADFAPQIVGNPVYGTIHLASNAVNTPSAVALAGQVLDIDPTTLVLTSSITTITEGTPVIFAVTASSAGTTPTGNVMLMDGTTVLQTVALNKAGFQFQVSNLTPGTHTITARYVGDASNAAAVSNAITETVKELTANTNTTLALSATSLNAGLPLTLTSTTNAANPALGNGPVGGTVSFKEGNTVLGTGTVTNGVGTVTITSLPIGQHTLVAVYNGSSSYYASTSTSATVTINLAASTATLSSSANPAVAGLPVTLTATLTSTGGLPTGQVSFIDSSNGSTLLGKAPVTLLGTASLTVPGAMLAVGSHSLSVSYAGDTNNSGTSGALVQAINIATTSTVVVTSVTPTAQGQSVTFTAKVTGTGANPTGVVQFFDGNNSLGSSALTAVSTSSATASFSTAALSVGNHAITASYAGDAADQSSTSAPVAQSVSNATTSIALTASANPAPFGSPVTFSVKVVGSGAMPTGTVTLQDGASTIGAAAIDPAGSASFTTSSLALGTHTLTAAFSGDTIHSAVVSTPLTETIVQVTATSISTTANPVFAGAALQWTAVITGGSRQPITGSVKFVDGSTVLAAVPLNANGTATFTPTALTVGTHTVTAAYAGDPLNQASTSPAIAQLVKIATTSTALTTSANPAATASPLVLTAKITGNGGVPTGTVTFLDGSASLGAVPVNAGGSAVLTVSTLAAGTHTLTASYGGDSSDAPSVSPAVQQQLLQQTAVGIASSSNPSLALDNVTITVTVSAAAGSIPPTGTVTLLDGASTLGTQAISSGGLAVFALASPAVGAHTLTATYSGDINNHAALSAALIQTVTLRPTSTNYTASASSISAGQPLTLFAVVQGTVGQLTNVQVPTGVVTFVSGNTTLGTATLNAAGIATVTVKPGAGSYNVVAQYPGDTVFGASSSAASTILVGAANAFTLTMQPPSISIASGAHTTVQINVNPAANFADTVALGCAGLPIDATCTFSSDQVKLAPGVPQTVQLTFDTGTPLGAGPTARLEQPGVASDVQTLACMLPLGALVGMLLWRGRKLAGGQLRRFSGLAVLLLMLSAGALLTGCGSQLNVSKTPAGSYSFRIVGTGSSTGVTQYGTVTLTVSN